MSDGDATDGSQATMVESKETADQMFSQDEYDYEKSFKDTIVTMNALSWRLDLWLSCQVSQGLHILERLKSWDQQQHRVSFPHLF